MCVGDFWLLGRGDLHAIQRLPERRRFMKELLSFADFQTTIVDYLVKIGLPVRLNFQIGNYEISN